MQSQSNCQRHVHRIIGIKILHFIWKHKKPQIVKAILRNKNGAGGTRLSDLRLLQNVIKIVWYRNIDNGIGLESSETNPQNYDDLTYDKEGKNIQWKEDSLSNNWCWENRTATCKRMRTLPNTIHKK